jgi:hypothetical protein
LAKTLSFISIFFMIILLFVGCTQTGSIVPDQVRFGSTGLKISFLKANQLNDIDEATLTDISVQLENSGATTIEEGYVRVTPEIPFSFISWEWGQNSLQSQDPTTRFYLEGRSKSNPNGETALLTAKIRVGALPTGTEVMRGNIRVQACYAYESIFAKEVCIDPNPDPRLKSEDTCKTSDVSSSGQGGPVGVTKVQIRYQTGEPVTSGTSTRYYDVGTILVAPIFDITIKNLDNGLVFDADQVISQCSDGSASKPNIVTIEASIFDTPLKCEFDHVTLVKGEAKVTCSLVGGVRRKQNSYLTPLVVKLTYGYAQTKTQEFTIRRRAYSPEEWLPDRPAQ